MSSVPQAPPKPGLPFWQRRAPCRELSGYVAGIVGYQENGRRSMMVRLSGSSSTDGRHFGVPYDMHPRHKRDTFSPHFPTFT